MVTNMIFLICIISVLAVLIVAFLTWFFSYKADGGCPLCAMKRLGGTKLTIDISNESDYDNNVSNTPIMGWSSWNTLRHHIDEQSIYEIAKVMKDSGLASAGYKFVNIDDCWQSSLRDKDGKLQGDLESFPSGMEALCKKINALDLKMGLYSSNGTLTCEDMPASLGNEELDAKTIASWGVEYLKYDFCHHEYISGSIPIIEYVDISKRGKSAFMRLNPEDAEFTGRARVVKCSGLPSKKGIGFLNHNAGTASYTVNVPAEGEYIFTVHYHKTLLHGKQYMQIKINGRIYEVFFPAGRSFSPDARIQIEVRLDSGDNRIKLCNPVATKADSAYIQYKRMGDALKNASKAWAAYSGLEEKPITYSICEWGFNKPWIWGSKAGNMWRTTMDIAPRWSSVKSIYSRTVKLYEYAGPGHVNDPDMLEVGNGKLTVDENKAHFTLWCMMAAPLVLGNDLRTLLDGSEKSNMILNVLTNKSLILIDQDPLVKPAKILKRIHGMDVLARPLANGDTAICFFNKTGSNKPVAFEIESLKEYKYLDFKRASNYEIHDLWSGDRVHGDNISATVPKHGVAVYRISQQ